jgi:hypothetical protein
MLRVEPHEEPGLLGNIYYAIQRLTEQAATKIEFFVVPGILIVTGSFELSNQRGVFLAIPSTYCHH